jgi:hypothetical protein
MRPVIFENILGCLVHPTGSSYICDPPVLTTDEDWLMYVDPDKLNLFRAFAYAYQFARSTQVGSYARISEQKDRFMAYRSLIGCQYGPNLNLIVTCDKDFYDKFRMATEESKRLNLLEKSERIELFQKVFSNKYIVDLDDDDSDCI